MLNKQCSAEDLELVVGKLSTFMLTNCLTVDEVIQGALRIHELQGGEPYKLERVKLGKDFESKVNMEGYNRGYFEVAELSVIWNISEEVIRELCRTGKLKAYHMGKYWRIPYTSKTAYEKSTANSGVRITL